MTATSPTGTSVEPVASGVQHAGFMQPDAMLAYLSDRLEARLLDSVIAHGQLTVVVDPEAWVDAVRLCKEDAALDCRYWEFLDAIDRGDDGFDCYVHVYSVTHRHAITLMARVPGGREKPVMPSLAGVFRGADWSERETYDMFGIDFEGHPGLEPRILTIENFEGWPLRKDFQLTSRNAKPWPGAKEPGEPGESHAAGDAAAVGAGDAPAAPEDKAAAAKEKAERAKAKAAAMRAQKAAERAAAEGGAPGTGDAVADAAETFGGGDTEGEAAAAAATAAGDETAATPEGAAEVADTDIAKDAAAGVPQGDTAAGATQDEAGSDEPVVDDAAEAEAAQGAPPTESGTPGTEAEGRHEGAEQQTVTEQRDADVEPAPGAEHDADDASDAAAQASIEADNAEGETRD